MLRNINISSEFQMWKHPKSPPQTTCKCNDYLHICHYQCNVLRCTGSVVLRCCCLCVFTMFALWTRVSICIGWDVNMLRRKPFQKATAQLLRLKSSYNHTVILIVSPSGLHSSLSRCLCCCFLLWVPTFCFFPPSVCWAVLHICFQN